MARKRRHSAIAAADPSTATAERLAKAARARAVETPETRGAEKVTLLFDGWPLKLLLSRKAITQNQFDAGLRYYEHHYRAGLVPHVSPSFDATGGASNSWDHSQMAASEHQAYHRQQIRAAREWLRPKLTAYMDLIVIDEVDAEEAARRLSGYRDRAVCRGVGTDNIIEALDMLIEGWGMAGGKRRA